MLGIAANSRGQTASFSFSAGSHPLSGWTNVTGDPSVSVITVADPSGITVNSVAIANWSQFGDQASFDGLGENVNGFFPGAVLVNHWYNYDNTFHSNQPQLRVTGLNKGLTYTLKMAGSSTSTLNTNPAVYTVIGLVNYGAIGVNSHNNITDGAIFNGISPDSTGSIWIYLNNVPWSQAADICGLVVITNPVQVSQLKPGIGVAQQGQTLSLGDSVTGKGPHSFTSNRYQFLNGHSYSFGGSVGDPVNHPVWRFYDNGDLAAGTTMDLSVNTNDQQGLRYYRKPGYLQVGASDRLDTLQSPIVNGRWPSSGIVISTDEHNTENGKLFNSIFVGDECTIDSGFWIANSYSGGELLHFNGSTNSVAHSFVGGYNSHFSAPIETSLLEMHVTTISKPVTISALSGFEQVVSDTVLGSIAAGAVNQFGGAYQVTIGQGLINRTPGGTALGNFNVDFSTLPFTGTKGADAPGIAGYPIFSLGNASVEDGTIRSNALSILYSGRTQINTTGHTSSLTQAGVTPKAALDVVSANTGVLFPRLTNIQRNSIAGSDLHNGLLLYNTDSSVFQFYNGTAWNMVGASTSNHWISAGGTIYDSIDNISLGGSNPQGYKLAVAGTGIFQQIVVKLQNQWPDYVFDTGYNLPQLQELERYILSHKHLPEMASEEEIAKEGLDVGGQQVALLKKIEELMLYLIRENESLNEENRQLGEQNSRLQVHQKELDDLKALVLRSKASL
jgi:hypothetical protein